MKATRTFPEYDNADLFAHMLDEFGGYDDSWKNDAMPSMTVAAYNNALDDVEIKIFVDYADQDKRDAVGYDTIAVYAYIDGDNVGTLWEGEPVGLYIDEIRRAIAHYQG